MPTDHEGRGQKKAARTPVFKSTAPQLKATRDSIHAKLTEKTLTPMADMSLLLFQSLTSFVVTLVAIVLLARLAPAIGLLDAPCDRKQHHGHIPLVGGIAIFIASVVGALLWGDSNQTIVTVNGNEALWVFMSGGAMLVVTGALDDRYGLGVFLRILSECAAALILVEGLDLRVNGLGNLFGTGAITLPPAIAYPFTVIAIFGVINAFNMLDGIDGLLAGLVLLTLLTFHLYTGNNPGFLSLFISASLLAFLVSNLQLTPLMPKSFLGDAGSKLLGFIMVSFILAAASQQVGGKKLIDPATALYLIGLPLFDMVFTSLKRVTKGRSPFAPDRSHIHHLLQSLGFSNRRTVSIILSISAAISLLGLILKAANVPESFQFSIFLGGFLFYSWITSQAWQISDRINRQAQRETSHQYSKPSSDAV